MDTGAWHDKHNRNPLKEDLQDLVQCQQGVGVEEWVVWNIIPTQVEEPCVNKHQVLLILYITNISVMDMPQY